MPITTYLILQKRLTDHFETALASDTVGGSITQTVRAGGCRSGSCARLVVVAVVVLAVARSEFSKRHDAV